MRSDENVARCGLEKFEALLKAVDHASMSGELVAGSRNCSQTIGVYHLVTKLPFARLPGPTRAARRMPGRQVRSENRPAELERLASVQFGDIPDACNRRDHAILRIVTSHAAVPHHRGTPSAGIHPRTTQTLQVRDPACVVEVDMRVDDDFDILNLKTEGTNVGNNLCGGLGQSAVNENVSCFRRDENRAQPMWADIIRVPKNGEWRLRTIPLGTR